MIDITINYEN